MNYIEALLPAIGHFHAIGYWIALFAALLETVLGIGLIIPGSTIILLMGALAAKGYFDLGDLLWFAIIGAIIGDNINYYLGKKYGRKILKKGIWVIKPKHVEKAEKFFKVHGAKSVFMGRFVPGLKETTSLIAGILNMKRSKFLIWNVLGAIGWGLSWILPGFFLFQSLDLAKVWLTRSGFFLFILLILLILFYLIKMFLVRKGKQMFAFLNSVRSSIKKALIENKEVKQLTEGHKNFFDFLHRRLDKTHFKGLPLTLLSIAFIYVLLLFGGIAENVINSDLIVSVDIRVANLLTIFRNADLTSIFLWITLLGKWQVIGIFCLTTALILILLRKRLYIIPLIISILTSELFTYISKLAFHRSRPLVAIYPETSYSFPSGHATIAIAFYGFITYLLIKHNKQWGRKINILFGCLILVLLIGFSRLYLGVHYLSDVWAGYLAGAIGLILAISLTEYFSYKSKGTSNKLTAKSKGLITALTVTALSFYTYFAWNYQPPEHLIEIEEKPVVIANIGDIFNDPQLKYTETLLGKKQEPLSFIIIAKDDQEFIKLFQKANWFLADEVSLSSLSKIGVAVFKNTAYDQAPITPDFWHTHVHDFGFEKPTESESPRERHHARFWKTNFKTPEGKSIYVGTASFDSGIKWAVTHKIEPDIDTEREFLFEDLEKTKEIESFQKEQFVDPVLGTNFTGDQFFTDGKIYIISLK